MSKPLLPATIPPPAWTWREMRRLLRTALLATPPLLLLGYASLWLVDRPATNFLASVNVGMSKQEVSGAVGEPADTLKPGDALPEWGNTKPCVLDSEAWVYYVFPTLRVTLHFDRDRLVAIQNDAT